MDVVSAISELLADKELRDEFSICSERVARRLLDDEQDVLLLCGIEVDQLNRQADLLIKKRLRAVSDLMPGTMADHKIRFLDYATTFWPEGHQRHHHDAFSFLAFLQREHCRICVREYSSVSGTLFPEVSLVRAGSVHTSRGWRFGMVARVSLFGRPIDVVLTLG